MDCRRVRFDLVEAASGRRVNLRSEAHLQTCANCAKQLTEMRRTMALLDEWIVPEPSRHFGVRLYTRLRLAAKGDPRQIRRGA
jgi:anti-sigma factor RsiW